MMKNIKEILAILLLAFVAFTIYQYFNPRIEIETETEYLPGDTVTVKDTVTVHDTTTVYKFKAVEVPAAEDAEIISAETPIYAADFNLGTEELGTSGRVELRNEDFQFRDVDYRFPKITISTTDTLKLTTTIKIIKPFYEDVWFYSTVIGIIFALTKILNQ